jgi:hypothetical protein
MPYVYYVDADGTGDYYWMDDETGTQWESTFYTGAPWADQDPLVIDSEAGVSYDPEAGGYQVYKDTSDPNNPKDIVVTPKGDWFLNGQKIWSPTAGGKSDWASLASKLGTWATTPQGMTALAATAFSLGGANKPQTGGWKGSIPKLAAVREQVEMPAYEPYSGKAVMGGKFFTDPQYVGKTDTAGITAAQDAAKAEAARLKGINPVAPAAAVGTKFADNTLTKKQDMSGLRDIYLMPGMTASPSGEPVTAAQQSGIASAYSEKKVGPEPEIPAGYKYNPADEVTSYNELPYYMREPEVDAQGNVLRYPDGSVPTARTVSAGNPLNTLSGLFKTAPADQSNIASLKEAPPQDMMSAVRAANPQLDWSQYNPNKMTMDVDAYQQAINHYRQYGKGMPKSPEIDLQTYADMQQAAQQAAPQTITAAQGGIMNLAKGRYLAGPTDGMADKIPSSIDGKQPAKLSHGEFVIPADVVSHLGNGNSEAGANQLYKMMDRVRKARTGSTKQGKKINPDKFTPGGIAGYASGGPVAFNTGGSTPSGLNTVAGANPNLGATQETNLAPWVGDYVGDMLGKSQALAGTGYQAFQGPLSAGTSPLQQQAFTSAGQINPQATFDVTAAQQYMNPFIQTALQPQLDEMRRQAEISRMQTAGRLSKAGAYGGGRQAIMESELLRNLGQQQALTTGKAYETAFDKAMGQYNTSRQQQLQDVGALAGLGAQQRQIEQQGIDQLRGEFEKQRQFPYEQLKFQQSMLTGLPIGSTTVTPNRSTISDLGLTVSQVGQLSKWLEENVFNKP